MKRRDSGDVGFPEIETSIVKLFINLLNQAHLFVNMITSTTFMMAVDLMRFRVFNIVKKQTREQDL